MIGFEPVYECFGTRQQLIAPVYYAVQVYQVSGVW